MKKTMHFEPQVFIDKTFFVKAFNLKYFFIASVFLFLLIAFLINTYVPKEYEIHAKIGLTQDSRSTMLGYNDMYRGYNSFDQGSTIETNISSLSSFSLISKVISSLNMEVGYFSEKNHRLSQPVELYLNSPFKVNIDKSHPQPIDTRLYLTILNDSVFRLSSKAKEVTFYNYLDNLIVSEDNSIEIDTICHFNETISNQYFKFSVSRNDKFILEPETVNDLYFFKLYHLDNLSKDYLERMLVEHLSPRSSIVDIQFSGQNIEKLLHFLNSYLESYLDENLEKKNKIARSTVNFIDQQLSEISDSLVSSESKLGNYRSANQVMDLSFQGQQIYEQMTQIESERANLEVQGRYFEYVIDYLQTNKDMAGVVPPSSMNVSDPLMNQLITEFLSLNSQKSEILRNSSGKNLFLGQIENKINLQKEAIIEYAKNNLNTLNLSINELNYRESKLSNEISRLPRKELNLVSMQRKFDVNDAIYSFLLQKRSESAIVMASNIPDYEILEPAREVTSEILSPKVLRNYFIAIFLGFLLPALYIILRDFLNNKISTVQEVERYINRSVIGNIFSNNQKTEDVVIRKPGSSISESFRNLRSALFLKLKSDESKIIIVTSSQPKDGKSFISLNLASSIASAGYKTIILDMDLRRPVLHEKLNESNSTGIANYMMKDKAIDEIIRKTSIPNLSFIPGGPVLPNPSELIESGVLNDFIVRLKTSFDYVILDTPPVGIVSDPIQLMKYATQVLMVCRINATNKDLFANALDILDSNGYTNYEIVLNDINLKKSSYSDYQKYYHD